MAQLVCTDRRRPSSISHPRFPSLRRRGGISPPDAQNLSQVADEFLSTVTIDSGKIAEVRTVALVGKVQSGKTTGMALTIAALADAGMQCFVILTGTKTTLTEQTDEDLREKFEVEETDRDWRWHFVGTATDSTADITRGLLDILDMPTDRPPKWRLVITCLKQEDNLLRLIEVLEAAQEAGESLDGRFVVFDDEGDQGSPDVSSRATAARSTLNRLIGDSAKNSATIFSSL